MDTQSFLHRLLHAFDAPKPAPLPEPDEKLALGALMVRVARSDDAYKFAEVHQIDLLLGRIFGLGPIDAAKLRALSEKLEKQAPGTDRFSEILCKTVSLSTRVDALEALWEVVLSDGERHAKEVVELEQLRDALGLTEEQSDEARSRAEQALA